MSFYKNNKKTLVSKLRTVTKKIGKMLCRLPEQNRKEAEPVEAKFNRLPQEKPVWMHPSETEQSDFIRCWSEADENMANEQLEQKIKQLIVHQYSAANNAPVTVTIHGRLTIETSTTHAGAMSAAATFWAPPCDADLHQRRQWSNYQKAEKQAPRSY